MLKAVGDNKLSLSTRSTAARSLGRLNYTEAAGINPMEPAAALGQFLTDACADVLRRATTTGKSLALRSWMRQPLADAAVALSGDGADESHKGIATLARDEGQRAAIDKLQKNINNLADFLDDQRHEKDDLVPPVEDLQKSLAEWLKGKPLPR